jgi:DNA-directed RNA polymerase subunit K/omega
MSKTPKQIEVKEEKDLESMILDYTKDKYKLVRTVIRWAGEIKQKQNLPDPISTLVPGALREILSGGITIEDIEKLPPLTLSASASSAPAAPTDKPAKKDKTEA